MTLTPTPTEELEMRQHGAKIWSLTWANATELTPEQAFTEGYLLAFWVGVVALRKAQLEAEQRIQRLLLLQLGIWAAITWVMAR